MLIITIEVNARPGQAIGIKEDLALYLERYGDARGVGRGGPAEADGTNDDRRRCVP